LPQLCDECTGADDQHSVADRRQLLVIGAGAENGGSLGLELVEKDMDLSPRSDVNALRRLVAKKNMWPAMDPLRKDRLLLVSA
jgi:hypothetical protein